MVLGLFHSGGAGPHVVRFTGLSKVPFLAGRGKVHVEAAWIPDTRFAPLARPIRTVDTGHDVRDGALAVVVPYVGNRDAYTVKLTAPPPE
jgi:hypothetical protein